MAAPAVNTDYLAIGYSLLLTAAANTADIADTVDPFAGGDPGTDWTYVGATEEGWTWGFEREANDHFIEEQSSAALTTPGNAGLTLSAALAEVTMENLKRALGGGTIVTTAAGSGQIGKKVLTFSDQYDSYAVVLYQPNAYGFWNRLYIPVVRSTSSFEVAFRRNEQKQLYNVQFTANCPMEQIKQTAKTANAA